MEQVGEEIDAAVTTRRAPPVLQQGSQPTAMLAVWDLRFDAVDDLSWFWKISLGKRAFKPLASSHFIR